MRGGANGPRLGIADRRVMQNAQQALFAVIHHGVERHRQAFGHAGRCLGLYPCQKLAAKCVQIGIDLAGHFGQFGWQPAPGIDMEELFQVLDRRILGIFRTKGEIAIMGWRLNGIVEFVLAGEEIAPAIIDFGNPVRRDGVVCQYGKAGIAQ